MEAGLWPNLVGTPGYHPLLFYSRAIDAGNPAGCTDHLGNPLPTDQRGNPRLGPCDIGAYEYDPSSDPLSHSSVPIIDWKYCRATMLFADDFSDPASGWPVLDTGTVLYEYTGGEYRILMDEPGMWAGAHPGLLFTDFSARVDARNVNGVYGTYGILFDVAGDWSHFYALEVDPFGLYYYLYRVINDNWVTLSEGLAPINYSSATNRLQIDRQGSQIDVYANGQLLASVQDSSFLGPFAVGLIGFSYGSPVDLRFDNFTVQTPGCGPQSTLHPGIKGRSSDAAGAHSPGGTSAER